MAGSTRAARGHERWRAGGVGGHAWTVMLSTDASLRLRVESTWRHNHYINSSIPTTAAAAKQSIVHDKSDIHVREELRLARLKGLDLAGLSIHRNRLRVKNERLTRGRHR